MLFNKDVIIDQVNVLDYIEAFSLAIGLDRLGMDPQSFHSIFEQMRSVEHFPCNGGIDKASVFKKASVFVICFMDQSPIPAEAYKESTLKEDLKSKNPNAIVALDIAFRYITESTIERNDHKKIVIQHGIKLSDHSYCDFLDMLTKTKLKLHDEDGHFMLMSLLFEQLTYKTNPELQYEDQMNTYGIYQEEAEPVYQAVPYSTSSTGSHPEWDDLVAFYGDLKPTK